MIVKRGDIFYADLSPVVGSEQGGIRPVLVVQNDVGNKYSPTIIVAAVTSRINKAKLPTHVEIDAVNNGLTKDSVVLLEQLRTIDKRRLKERIGTLAQELIPNVDEALSVSLGITNTATNADTNKAPAALTAAGTVRSAAAAAAGQLNTFG